MSVHEPTFFSHDGKQTYRGLLSTDQISLQLEISIDTVEVAGRFSNLIGARSRRYCPTGREG